MSTNHDIPDETLVEHFIDGDDTAFVQLVDRYHDGLMRFLRRMTGSHAIAEDVFQDTFLQVHNAIESFDTSRRFKPWLFTIAANKARDELRRLKRRKAASLSASPSGSTSSYVDLMAIDLPSPESPMEDAERAALVQNAIDAMPIHQREILLMAYFQRMPYQQLAEVFDIPLGTVKSRLHAAVASFAKRWQEQMDARKRRQDAASGRDSGESPA